MTVVDKTATTATEEQATRIDLVVESFPVKLHEAESAIQDFISNLPGLSPADIFIETEDQYHNSNEICKTVKRLGSMAEDTRKVLVKPLNDYVSGINQSFKPMTERLNRVENAFKGAMLDYKRREDEKRKEEERKARERADQIAAEQRRQADIQRQKEEKQRQEAERLRLEAEQAETEKEREKLLKQADKKEVSAEKFSTSAAVREEMAQAAEAAPLNVLVAAPVKAAGQSVVMRYKSAVQNKAEFVRWCLESGQLHYLEINTSMIDKAAAASKGSSEFPGIVIESSQDLRVGTKR